uniref:Uncharacterized protein n=1 Tax=Octopus bimaculoides TaxID=37653 RepID=A0A0L8GTT0_OCTBM
MFESSPTSYRNNRGTLPHQYVTISCYRMIHFYISAYVLFVTKMPLRYSYIPH